MAWHNKPIIGKRRQDYLVQTFNNTSHELDKIDLNTQQIESEFESIMSKLIRAWSIDDTYNSKQDYKFEYLSRHSPLLIAKSGFGGIAHEIWTSNRPVFRILKLNLGINGLPIAIVAHGGTISHVDISPLFVNLSANKRKKILKYDKVTDEFSREVYQFVANIIKDTLWTKF